MLHTIEDARLKAKQRLPRMIFEYIDGAAGSGYGEQHNMNVLQAIRLQPRVLQNVEKRTLNVNVFGKDTQLPFGICPMGLCNLASPKADRLLAALSARYSIPLGVSTAASTSLEDMARLSEGNAWFQLYFSGNKNTMNKLINRAKHAGYETLILTVDVPEVGRRPRELRRGFKMPFKIDLPAFIDFALHPQWSIHTLFAGRPILANFGGDFGEFNRTSSRAGADWDLLKHIRNTWHGNLVVKGILDIQDAQKAKSIGVDAIEVSSHGGRQLDSAPAPIIALRAIREAIGENYPLFYDTGLRNGEDIIKAYAMGANYVFLGRAFSYAIAANGATGLTQTIDFLQQEISLTLAQLGKTTLNDIDQSVLSPHISF